MLLFDNYDIKVYATPLQRSLTTGGRRRVAELAAVKSLLREAFPTFPDARIAHAASGAPYLIFSGKAPAEIPAISISHSRDLAVLAVAPEGTRIGVDAETGDRANQLLRVAPRFLSQQQMPFWGSSPSTLLRAWTIKEALYKAAGHVGMGLLEIPLPLEVPFDAETPDARVDMDGRPYTVLRVDAPGCGSMVMLVFAPPYSL